MTTPERVQRKRTKGWRMPENTVYVGRPSKWGNPFGGVAGKATMTREYLVEDFRRWLTEPLLLGRNRDGEWGWQNPGGGDHYQGIPYADRDKILDSLHELRGKNLACWCPLSQPCHADVLLELANQEVPF